MNLMQDPRVMWRSNHGVSSDDDLLFLKDPSREIPQHDQVEQALARASRGVDNPVSRIQVVELAPDVKGQRGIRHLCWGVYSVDIEANLISVSVVRQLGLFPEDWLSSPDLPQMGIQIGGKTIELPYVEIRVAPSHDVHVANCLLSSNKYRRVWFAVVDWMTHPDVVIGTSTIKEWGEETGQVLGSRQQKWWGPVLDKFRTPSGEGEPRPPVPPADYLHVC